MKISNKKLKKIIAEEKKAILSNDNKLPNLQFALREIAMQSAILHDSEKLSKIDENDLKKIKSIAEYLDSIFYRTLNS